MKNETNAIASPGRTNPTTATTAEQADIMKELFGVKYEVKAKSKAEQFEDYDGFVAKFKPKKTTDDCYTPHAVYQVVRDYVAAHVDLRGKRVLRPFYPGGNYEEEDYDENTIVIDNPPFSILAQIKRFYIKRDIPFFLFAPTLTLFTSALRGEQYIVTGARVIYENGAAVSTSFVTNMWGDDLITVDGDFRARIEAACKVVRNSLPKYKYPNNVVSAATLGKVCRQGVKFSIKCWDAVPIKKLDYQGGSAIFGGGYLLSSKAAAKEAAAKEVLEFKLSARELRIIEELDKAKSYG